MKYIILIYYVNNIHQNDEEFLHSLHLEIYKIC